MNKSDIAPEPFMAEAALDAARGAAVIKRYEGAKDRRTPWLSLWESCYDYALPQHAGFTFDAPVAKRQMQNVFDATALDAVDQLAASMLGHLTPIWTQWFGLIPGPDVSEEEAQSLAPVLEKAARVMQSHFDRSNFAMEIHQCYLDLVVGGTASLAFEESAPGDFSAFKFQAIPLKHIVLEEGATGFLDGGYRILALTLDQMMARYSQAVLPKDVIRALAKDPQARINVLEGITQNGSVYDYVAVLNHEQGTPIILQAGTFNESPIISFRWSKTPGEIYGRSPVMKALPDIKTANKVVELILKNASIAVTGIWQADDDGVLNPANIELVPGSIIPKAVGSKGLQPLDMPGQFDVSQIMLENLQGRIRHALLVDRLAPVGTRMTATEVLERTSEMALLLSATYGRLQSELLLPLIKRAYAILRRRGEVPDLMLDGRNVMIDFRSPLARAQGQSHVQNTLQWVNAVQSLGAEGAGRVDVHATARYLREAMAVPSDLMRSDDAIIS